MGKDPCGHYSLVIITSMCMCKSWKQVKKESLYEPFVGCRNEVARAQTVVLARLESRLYQ